MVEEINERSEHPFNFMCNAINKNEISIEWIYRWSMYLWGEWEHLWGELWCFMPDFPAVNISASSCDSTLSTGHGLRLTPLCLQFHSPGNLPCWVRNSYNHNTTRYEIIKQKFQVTRFAVSHTFIISIYTCTWLHFPRAYHSLERSGRLAT